MKKITKTTAGKIKLSQEPVSEGAPAVRSGVKAGASFAPISFSPVSFSPVSFSPVSFVPVSFRGGSPGSF